ncbi:hypothetical protein PIB30_002053 [Stylosanthes scabra]|uniref:Leucine-rich repeat-containing N-terminal plant-type domain-containing protein n=1 Tax=Stylosanthes scabra TaxID=79078 RepID=A0ABU6Q2T3_9FABA|nr:hypothetical protein [Stylosanthes scabra]
MDRFFISVHFFFVVFSAALISQNSAFTDPLDVTALQDLYRTLNTAPVLERWDGDDPCQESWTGVACSGSSVIHLKLQGLNLTGYLGGLLHNLQSLKHLDVSSNNIVGEIPSGLPPNVTHINMACNYLSQNIPPLSTMRKLKHLNLSHNFLYGPVGNVFTGLDDLKEMDLSYNNFTGDLPSSFGSLKNLGKLYLENNRFTGSVTYLAELTLTDLNIQDNLFSGILPPHFQTIQNLWIGGNKFQAVDESPPWPFPLDNVSVEHNSTRPPTTRANAIENYASAKAIKHKKKHMGPGGIALTVGGVTLFAAGLALFIATRMNRPSLRQKKLESIERSFPSHPFNLKDISTTAVDTSLQIPPFNSKSLLGPRRLPSLNHKKNGETSRRSFSEREKVTGRTKVYTVAEIQLVTKSFSEDNLLGAGSLGSVYRAEFPDGKVPFKVIFPRF